MTLKPKVENSGRGNIPCCEPIKYQERLYNIVHFRRDYKYRHLKRDVAHFGWTKKNKMLFALLALLELKHSLRDYTS